MEKTSRAMQGIRLMILILLAVISTPRINAHAQIFSKIEGRDAVILFSPGIDIAARDVAALYPTTREQLERTLLWKIDFRPVIVLVGDRRAFRQMAGHDAFVAFAVPEKWLIVIDETRMSQRPFSLEQTLKHELCHLLLHRHLKNADLPKWLDEGVAQWISEGIPELVDAGRGSPLIQSAFAGHLYSLDALAGSFPQDGRGLALAYEESRSVVEYIIEGYGKDGILNLLHELKRGTDVNEAVRIILLSTLPELEKRWQESLLGPTAILSFLAMNLYTIIFVLAALLTFLAYLRFLMKKRRMKDDPEEEEDEISLPK